MPPSSRRPRPSSGHSAGRSRSRSRSTFAVNAARSTCWPITRSRRSSSSSRSSRSCRSPGDPGRPRPEDAPLAGDRAAARLERARRWPRPCTAGGPDDTAARLGAFGHLRRGASASNRGNQAVAPVTNAGQAVCRHLVSGNCASGERSSTSRWSWCGRHAPLSGSLPMKIGTCSRDGAGAEIFVTNAQRASIRRNSRE